MQAGLYVVGTPIGNLQDITLRALETLKSVNLILAEDTRETRKLLDRHGLHTPMLSYHKFNEASRVAEILDRIKRGEALALVTDSGMPGVSDPGARVVEACRAEKLYVTTIPGPSSLTAAISVCGLREDGFVFGGFLPHKSGQRKKKLLALALARVALVLFESPYRLLKLMDELEELWPSCSVFVGRELTKHFEELLSGTPATVRESFRQRSVKGELVVIVRLPEES